MTFSRLGFNAVVRLLYLWSRDADMPVNDDTKHYLVRELQRLHLTPARYSDKNRELMVRHAVHLSERGDNGTV